MRGVLITIKCSIKPQTRLILVFLQSYINITVIGGTETNDLCPSFSFRIGNYLYLTILGAWKMDDIYYD